MQGQMWFCGGWEGPAAIPGAAQESNLPALCFPAPLSFHSTYHSPQRLDFAPKIQCIFCFSSLVFARAGCFSESWQQIAHNFKDSTCGSDFALRKWSWTRLWIRLWLWSWIVLSAASKVWAAAAPAPTADKSSWEEWREIDRTQSHHQDEEHSHTIEIAGDGGGNTIVPLHPWPGMPGDGEGKCQHRAPQQPLCVACYTGAACMDQPLYALLRAASPSKTDHRVTELTFTGCSGRMLFSVMAAFELSRLSWLWLQSPRSQWHQIFSNSNGLSQSLWSESNFTEDLRAVRLFISFVRI